MGWEAGTEGAQEGRVRQGDYLPVMTSSAPVLDTERHFFDALLAPSSEILDRLLTDDFILIDVLTGSEVSKSSLLDFMGSGQLTFESIVPAETRVRMYGPVAVVTGRTAMKGRVADQSFTTFSRYTHVYVEAEGKWRMASAQGTPIT
jgi:hypothetical protein